MYSKHWLKPGQRLVSPDRHTEAVFGVDGNFVLRNQRGVIWATHTINQARGGRLLLQTNGRLVVLDAQGHVRWRTTPTSTAGSAKLRVLDSGQLAIYSGGKKIWHTNTHTP
jgi:hypothetical protein